MSEALFACTKCNSRHPFEELSVRQQLCKSCLGAVSLLKCIYCMMEFPDIIKPGIKSVCDKCVANVKKYGKPSACEYCNTIAAFIGSKCQRCTNSEKKYGLPVICDQCKQRCAFDHKECSQKKVDAKLCYFCTLSHRRALAKTKQCGMASRHSSSDNLETLGIITEPSSPPKKIKTERTSDNNTLMDPNMSDHVVVLTQLKDQVKTLEKKLVVKDQQMLMKDKQISELKCQYGVLERELRLKIQSLQKQHRDIVDDLQSKVRVLTKQVVTLTKLAKKNNVAI